MSAQGVIVNFTDSTVTTGRLVPLAVSAANPLPVTLSGGLSGLQVSGVTAPGVIPTTNPVLIGGVDGTGAVRNISTDGTGRLNVNVVSGGGGGNVQGVFAAGTINAPFPLVSGGFDTGGVIRGMITDTAGNTQVVGDAANGAADTGSNPVKGAGVYSSSSTITALTVGNRGVFQLDPNGNIRVAATIISGTGSDGVANNRVGFQYATTTNSTGSSAMAIVLPYVFNGSTWDRPAKPRTAFRLPSSAATNNAANIKTTPGTVYSISANVTLAVSTCYLKLFDTTGVPNPAALTPLYMFTLNIVDGAVSFNLPANGLYFPTGIGVAIVANPADLDNTAIAAGQVTALNVSFQ